MYRLDIVTLQGTIIYSKMFPMIKDIIQFTHGRVTYNDTKKRLTSKKYKTYKRHFIIKKI